MHLLLSSYSSILMDIEKGYIRDVANDAKHLAQHLKEAPIYSSLKDVLIERLTQLNSCLQRTDRPLNAQDLGMAYADLFDQLLLIYYGLSAKERKQAQPLPFSILERVLVLNHEAKLASQGVTNFPAQETYLASDPDKRHGVQVYKIRNKLRTA